MNERENTVRGFQPLQAKVVYWKIRGLSNMQIANKVGLNNDTDVENQLRHIYSDLKFDNVANNQKANYLKSQVKPIMDKLVGNDTSKLDEFPLSLLEDGVTEASTEPTTELSPHRNRFFIFVLVGLALFGLFAIWIFFFVMPEYGQGIPLGDSKGLKETATENEMSLYLANRKWEQGRGDGQMGQIWLDYELKNGSQDTKLAQFTVDDLEGTDNRRNDLDCVLRTHDRAIREISQSISPDGVFRFSIICGIGQVPKDVTEYRVRTEIAGIDQLWVIPVER